MSKKTPQDFIKTYKSVAEQVGREIGVDPNVLLSQWALESQWGNKIPASHNIAGIKDFSGKGTAARDSQLGTIDKYVEFEDPEVFGMYYADLIKRKFPNAVNTGPDIGAFTRGLMSGESGSYFGGDPQRYAVGLTAIHNSIPGAEEAPRPNVYDVDETASAATRPAPAEGNEEISGTLDDMRREELERADLEAQERRQAQLYGGGAGAALSTTKAVGSVAGSAIEAAAKRAAEGRSTVEQEVARQAAARQAAAANLPPGSSIMRQPQPIPVGQDAGGRAVGRGSANFNYGTAFGLTPIEAAQATSMSNQPGGAGDLIKQRAAGLSRVQQAFPGGQFVENPRYGGLMTPTDTRAPRESFRQLGALTSELDDPRNLFPGGLEPGAVRPRAPVASSPISTAPPAPSMLERVSDNFKRMMGPISSGLSAIGRYAVPPLALASAAGEGMNIAQQYRRPSSSGLDALGQPMVGGAPERDYTSMGLSGLNILGGALSLFPPTAPVGIPLSIGTAATQAYRDNPEVRELIRRRMMESSQTPFSDPMTGNIYP